METFTYHIYTNRDQSVYSDQMKFEFPSLTKNWRNQTKPKRKKNGEKR